MYNSKPETSEQEYLQKIKLIINTSSNSTHKTVNLMSTLNLLDDFDILFHDFFRPSTNFFPLNTSNTGQVKLPHPVNIYYNKEGLNFEIACTGLSKEDIILNIEEDMLKISYNKPELKEIDDSITYIHRGLSQRSFNLGYKVSSKFDLSKTDATLEKGLLKISIPVSEQAKPKQLVIK